MVYYINRGLILEQAIVEELKKYFSALHLDDFFENFHINITNKHPFETLYFGDNDNAADTFPAIVVTTASDVRVPELTNLIPQIKYIGLELKDFNELVIESQGESENRDKKPGICTLITPRAIEDISEYFKENDFLFGFSTQHYRQDSISIEIWCENNQLKNEIYEYTRLFVLSTLKNYLAVEYPNYAISYNDNTVNGQRSNNFNLDFDVPLSGAQITLDIDYSIQQLVFDTKIKDLKPSELIWEVHNHVKTDFTEI